MHPLCTSQSVVHTAAREAVCQCAVAVPASPPPHRARIALVVSPSEPAGSQLSDGSRRAGLRFATAAVVILVHARLFPIAIHKRQAKATWRARSRRWDRRDVEVGIADRVRSVTWRGVGFSEWSDQRDRGTRPPDPFRAARPAGLPAGLPCRSIGVVVGAFSSPSRTRKCTAASLVPLHQRKRTKPSAGPPPLDSHVRVRTEVETTHHQGHHVQWLKKLLPVVGHISLGVCCSAGPAPAQKATCAAVQCNATSSRRKCSQI
jgi:hypothetical protein